MTTELTARVLVLGDNDLAGLAAVRALGRAGLEVHLAAWDPKPITRRSRYVARVHDLGNPREKPERFTDGVLDLIQRTTFDTVLPTTDESIVPLMPHRDEINRWSRFAGPNPAGFEVTQNKAETVRLARELGIIVPNDALVTDRDQIDELADDDWPKVLKPARSFVASDMRDRLTVRVVRSRAAMLQVLPEMVDRCPVLVQEFCRGPGLGVNVLARGGEIVAAYQHRRVHEPPQGGTTSYTVTERLDELLLDGVRRFCAAIELDGPANFEYKHDPARDRRVLMEVNGRLWASVGLGVRAGVNFPVLHYELLTRGRVTPAFEYRVPRYIRHTRRDFFWFFMNLGTPTDNPNLLKVRWPALVREPFNLLRGREGFDLESIRDPVPGLLGWIEVGREVSRRARGRLTRRRFARLARRSVARIRSGDNSWKKLAGSPPDILFLCTGNINRSAFAERYARNLPGKDSEWHVASAGLATRDCRQTSEVSKQAARKLGVDLDSHRSRAVTPEELKAARLLVVMDPEHLRLLDALAPGAARRAILLAAFDERGSRIDIPDPFGKDEEAFDETYARIARSVRRLADRLRA